MSDRQTTSSLIQKAQEMIQEVKGKKLSLLERQEKAIQLAALMLEEAHRIQTSAEKKQQMQLAGMLNDVNGKLFTTTLTDQCFRSQRPQRAADQLVYIINQLGVPSYLPWEKKWALKTFRLLGKPLAAWSVPLTIQMIRKETNNVILPGEKKALIQHLQQRKEEGVRTNLNHLGEAILGEEEAQERLQVYLDDLANPAIEYISVKISTIYSQISLLAWEQTLTTLADRLRLLYRAAAQARFVRIDGTAVPKFVNLDMEEYRDLRLTVDLFRLVLDEPEFHQYEAGIVLQSYLPDSFLIQQELTIWAMQRVAQGGVPIKIRLVKGANLAMECVEAGLRRWPQAPYRTKGEVDANFKRMMNYGCQKREAQAAHLGIGSHNLFDIAYALLLRAENDVEKEVGFEMLEGMADHMRRVVQKLAGDMLLYCPVATKQEFQNAVAYLVRRLDENTAPDNFLRQAFDLKPQTTHWDKQAELFAEACLNADKVSYFPQRTQNRLTEKLLLKKLQVFENEPDTDWSLTPNRLWAETILKKWQQKKYDPIPLVIGQVVLEEAQLTGQGVDPSFPGHPLYRYMLATSEQIEQALNLAKEKEKTWGLTPLAERMQILARVASLMRQRRGDLIGAMVADTAKTVMEADVEVSEAIDFAEYYRLNAAEWHLLKEVEWSPKGTILVAPPWNFPCSISAGGILAALMTGNCVLFKPPSEAVLVGWTLVQLFWEAGVSQEVLQFITCEDEPVGSQLIRDKRINAIILTGATSTAKHFLNLRPGLDLMAETGGKNTMVITSLADRDLAIKDLVQSAFGHAGQKCSACSLAILEAELYDDPHFLQQLRDAAASLHVGSPWSLDTKVNPLIREPSVLLQRALTELEEGEAWLLEPKQDKQNSNLWSPGIKLGVKPRTFTFQNELFGPVLGLVRAETVAQAFEWMNQTPYGLTAGLHSLDSREQEAWLKQIQAGNCYINRTITGAIVERQPFGGCKESSFGKGSKAGGPNYLVQLMQAKQLGLPPEEQADFSPLLALFAQNLEQDSAATSFFKEWQTTAKNYAFYWDSYFSRSYDPSLVLGQDNFQRYIPHAGVILRVQPGDAWLDILNFITAALICGTPLSVSVEEQEKADQLQKWKIPFPVTIQYEPQEAFIARLEKEHIKRVRVLQPPPLAVEKALAHAACHINRGKVMANGRLEFLHLLREMSISYDYHRYGNLGNREKEKRDPLPKSENRQKKACETCDCHD